MKNKNNGIVLFNGENHVCPQREGLTKELQLKCITLLKGEI